MCDTASGKRKHNQRCKSARFSPDLQHLAVATTDDELVLWDPETGRDRWRCELRDADHGKYRSSPDGKTIFAAEYGGVWRIDAHTRTKSLLIEKLGLAIQAITLSPDGKQLALGSYGHPEFADQGVIGIYETATGTEGPRWRTDDPSIMGLVSLPDGRKLVFIRMDEPSPSARIARRS